MQFDPVLIAPRLKPMTAAGHWRNQTINHFMAQALAQCPEKNAVVAYRSDRAQPERLSYRELDQRVTRVARGLQALGPTGGNSSPLHWPVPASVPWPTRSCRFFASAN
jgi:cyclohexanecarboxylate-CoA ligase